MSCYPGIQDPKTMDILAKIRGYSLFNNKCATSLKYVKFYPLFNNSMMQSLHKVICKRRTQTCSLINFQLRRNMAFSRSKVLLLENELENHAAQKKTPNKSPQIDTSRKEAYYKKEPPMPKSTSATPETKGDHRHDSLKIYREGPNTESGELDPEFKSEEVKRHNKFIADHHEKL